MRALQVLTLLGIAVATPTSLSGQTTPLMPDRQLHAIRDESSGELPLVDFRAIESRFSGFTPSKGGDGIADYIASRMREHGLSDVRVEGFPSDGKTFFWAFLTEPAWEAEAGSLVMVEPRVERLADFSVHRVVLGRFSSTASVKAAVVDVGRGLSPSDFQGKNVKGKVVLASGDPGRVHALAVWEYGAVGLIWYRTVDAAEAPHLVSNPALVPWTGPRGEQPGFAFAVPYTTAMELRDLLQRGMPVVVDARVQATTGSGNYNQVEARIPGSDPTSPEVWVYAHSNYRNTGGGNNLTGVGATIEVARVLSTLIARGKLPRPKRSIRFLWGAEHHAIIYNFYSNPQNRARAQLMLNVDMVGYHQERAKAVFRLYRLPHSRPHFLSDVAEEFMHAVGHANSVSLRNVDVVSPRPGRGFYDPMFAPTGSRDQLHYAIEEFAGPSDHEDVVEASIGLPAVLYNDWPVSYLGTQEDNIEKVDPTQMRRAVVTIAATAYFLSSAPTDAAASLGPILLAYGQSRMAKEASRASALLTDAGGTNLAARYREGTNILTHSLRRELAAITSLSALGNTPADRAAIARARRQLEVQHAAHAAAFEEYAAAQASARQVRLDGPAPDAGDRRLGALVPQRNDAIRGPIHFFRHEYGLAWLRQKTAGQDFYTDVALTQRGHYVLYEALNFADGTRNLLEIRAAVSAEHGSVGLMELEQYFRFLERMGVVTMSAASPARR